MFVCFDIFMSLCLTLTILYTRGKEDPYTHVMEPSPYNISLDFKHM